MMAMERDHLALPYEYLKEMEELTDEEFGQLVRALMKYSRDGEQVPREGNMRFYAARVMAREDRYQKAYMETTDKRKAAGKCGAAKRWGENNKDSAAILSNSNDEANGSNAIADNGKDSNAILPLATDSKNGQAEAEAEAEAYTEADSSFLSEKRKEPKEFPAGSRAQEKTLLVALGCGKTSAPPTSIREIIDPRAGPGNTGEHWDHERQRWIGG